MSCALGFLPLFAGDRPDTIALPASPGPAPRDRVALLFPVYHEDPARIAGTVEAMAEELRQLNGAQSFDVFVLSDTRGAEAGAAEEVAYTELRRRLSRTIAVFYRRRLENKARKAGNIEDWVERFGGAYDHFIILDADSVMSGATLMRLAHAMEQHPKAGLIQTVPRLTGGTTLLQRLQQFAGNVYGPAVAAGLAFWHRDQGNYWGHNAIIRTKAFAAAAGLPELPGKAPFGGHIQSHDFVEAVLLQRAGWGVHMVPTVDGSYEGLPPTLTDLVVRDRRWAQGNLQHLSIVGAPGLTGMGRVHLLFGACSYLVSAVWAGSLAVGVVLALQGQQLIPSYFQDSKTLFPIWPVIDPGAALRLFLATMAVVLLPKAMGLVLEAKRVLAARERGGIARALFGTVVETVFSMLLAPIFMVTQTTAVFEVLLGRDSGWKQQPRDGNEVPFAHAVRFHWRHMALGWALAAVIWQTSPALVAWMAPVILGLILSAPITWLTSQQAGPILSLVLSTQEDRAPPPILASANRQTAEWMHRLAAMHRERAGVPHAA
jgi:membrane glycosyltransferase